MVAGLRPCSVLFRAALGYNTGASYAKREAGGAPRLYSVITTQDE